MNKTITRWASRLLLLLLVACMAMPTAVAESVVATKPTSVKLDQKGTVTLAIGDTLTLNATLYPEGAQSTLKWKSSKKKIASVKGGVVTPKKVGTTTITVTTKNKKKARVKIKVIDPYKPSKVYLDKTGTQTILMGESLQLNAALYPETAKSTLKWKSSNKRVAVVDQNGMVGAISTGKTTITVTTRNKKKAKVKVKVIDNGNVPIWTPNDYTLPYLVYVCKTTHTIAILARDANGEWTRVLRLFSTGLGRKNVTDVGYFSIVKKERWHKWGSGYSPFANKLNIGIYLHGPIFKEKNQNTIRPSYYNCIGKDCSSGCIRTTTGAAAWIYYNCPLGTLVFVAPNGRFSTPRPKKISKKATKDPTDPGDHPEVLITGFTLDPAVMTLEKGASQNVTPGNINPSNTSTTGFTFSSSNTSVATVNASGTVTAVGAGTAVIQAIANDDYKCSATTTVNVTDSSAAATTTDTAKVTEAASVETPEEVIAQDVAQSPDEGALTAVELPAEEVTVAQDASFAEVADEPAAPVEDEIVETPVEEPVEAPTEEPVEAPADEPAGEPAEETVGETTEEAPGEDAAAADVASVQEAPAEPDPALNADEDGLTFAGEEVPEAEEAVVIDQESTNE